MANNYLQFSEELTIHRREAPWFRALLDALDDELLTEPTHNTFGGGKIDKAFKAIRAWPAWNGSLDFQYEVRDDSVWFFSEEAGEPYLVGLVVQQYFKIFCKRGNPIFKLTWASFCDKLRLGEFDGGGMIVTRDHIEIRGANEWMDEYLKKKQKRKSGT